MNGTVHLEFEGRLAENILFFCRTLRKAGLPIGPGQVIDAGNAVLGCGIERRDDFFSALRSVLVTDPAHFRIFDQAFHIYFRNPRLLERMMGLLLPKLETQPAADDSVEAVRRLREAMSAVGEVDSDDVVVDIDQSESFSNREILRRKDFEQMSLDEQAQARMLLRTGLENLPDTPTRRYAPSSVGGRYDLRRSIRMMLRNNGQLLQLPRRKKREKPPLLVLLCDVSGSMSHYTRIFLHFAHALSARGQIVYSFVFGTQLTNISCRLRDRNVDRALAGISADVRDWDGGTRIAHSLKRFNSDWSRRVLSRHSVVVLLSDGLERDTESDLAFQMARLQRSCDQLLWLNPLLRFDAFEPKASGIRAMLPFVDSFLPAHNVASLLQLAAILGEDKLTTYQRVA